MFKISVLFSQLSSYNLKVYHGDCTTSTCELTSLLFSLFCNTFHATAQSVAICSSFPMTNDEGKFDVVVVVVLEQMVRFLQGLQTLILHGTRIITM